MVKQLYNYTIHIPCQIKEKGKMISCTLLPRALCSIKCCSYIAVFTTRWLKKRQKIIKENHDIYFAKTLLERVH